MKKLIITTFTDPMMGLSYESEPLFRKLETHFPDQIEFRTVMSLLVRDARDFMTPEERTLEPGEGFRRYNARLAIIYEGEESIGGMPICMEGFDLFAPDRPSSLPLCLAYEAVRLVDPDRAERFLYRLRYATIVETRPTTKINEILKVVQLTVVPPDRFWAAYTDGSARAALEKDLLETRRLGVHSLPAHLIQYGDEGYLLQSFSYGDFVKVIRDLTDGAVTPQKVTPSREAMKTLLAAHPLISPLEILEALELPDLEEVQALLQALLLSGTVAIQEASHGWFVQGDG